MKCIVILLLLLVAGQCLGTVYVDSRSAGAVHDGRSWGSAVNTIGAALVSAGDGEAVWVKAGVYRERLTIGKNTALYGGFIGTEASPADRVMGAFPSVIDAGGGGRVVDIPSGCTATIDGLNIVNGTGDNGAGIRVSTNALAYILNCRIEHCKATGLGGGVYFGKYCSTDSGDDWGKLENCVVQYNEAESGGGVVVEYHSYTVIRGCLIARNKASKSGGGVYCPFHSGADFENCTIAYNKAGSNGGGAYCHYGGPQVLNHCIIAFNSAPDGGGLYGLPLNYTSSTKYSYCDLFSNSGGDYGGNIKPPSSFTGNFSVNPKFVLPAMDEFHLMPVSPCAKVGAFPIESASRIERIGSIKQLSNGDKVTLSGKLVSAVGPQVTYVKETDRAATIAVKGLSGLHVGDLLTSLSGTVRTDKLGKKLIESATCKVHPVHKRLSSK